MTRFLLSELIDPLAATLRGADLSVNEVSTDTRTLPEGALFVALQGPNFDGHDYLEVAAERGAAAAVVARASDLDLPQLTVADTHAALGRLGRAWRERSGPTLIALTGSNGKTTLKEMLAAVLAGRGKVLATRGNLNNDIGVPLTLCRLSDERFAVIEMGANHAGEIDYLTRMAAPDVAILNNAGRAHLEGFGSLEGVARAKAEIINGLGASGVFVYNADDRFAPLWAGLWSEHVEQVGGDRALTFGIREPADVSSRGEAIGPTWDHPEADGFRVRFPVVTPVGEVELELALAGHHNRMNALAATAAAIAVGTDLATIRAGLAGLKPVPGRLRPLPGRDGCRLIDDSYNANPDSVAAAIAVLASAPGRRTLVLGDLAELGEGAEDLHAAIGEQARDAGIHRLYSSGPFSGHAATAFGAGGRAFANREALIDALDDVGADDSILVKGSRLAGMEVVVDALSAEVTPC